MILLKPHVWEKSGSQFKSKNAPGPSDCKIFKLQYLKNYFRYKVGFVHVISYLLKLQFDHVILHEWCQACPVVHKEAFEIYVTQKLAEFQS